MKFIDRIKGMWFEGVATLLTTISVKMYKDRLIIMIGDEVVYKGKDYDKYKGTGKAFNIKSKGDVDGEMRAMFEKILRREGLM